MNTIGNLGGFCANIVTGFVLDLYTANVDKSQHTAYYNASQPAWAINFLVFTGVYFLAALLWLNFDATKTVDPDESSGHT
jgi:hypothetical protein